MSPGSKQVVRTIGLMLVVAVLTTGPSGQAAGAGQPRPVKVMTRNLYLGADLNPAIRATTIPQLLAAVSHIFSVVQETNFPERAVSLAREIADADPVLIGLQEVAIWFSGPINDPAPASHVEYDFLQSLLQELTAAGAPYDVVRVQAEADIEAPAGAPYFRDFRLVQHDVILVKAGLGDEVALSNARSANFVNTLVITTGLGLQFPVKRGWLSVDATVNGRSFRFVNTHLEAFHPGFRLLQAQELVAPTGPVGSAAGDVVLVGDLNTSPDVPNPLDRLAYFALVGFGLVDTWVVLHPGDPGYTAGFSELLHDPSPAVLDNRVDHVMTLGTVEPIRSRITGLDPDNRTVTGMWPSDHAGVVATLAP